MPSSALVLMRVVRSASQAAARTMPALAGIVLIAG
jgi:hypothetical protein